MLDDYVNSDLSGGEDSGAVSWMDDNSLYYGYDTDGDGAIDTLETYSDFDEYGNPHHYEMGLDTDHNGVIDQSTAMDLDDMGNAISYTQANDYNQDGEVDMLKTLVDSTGTGDFDTAVQYHADNSDSDTVFNMDVNQDLTGDHNPDQTMNIVGIDTDGDGQADIVRITGQANGTEMEPVEMSYDEWASTNGLGYSTSAVGNTAVAGNFDPDTDPSQVSGDPANEMQYWEYQGNTGRCALYAQKFVVESITGQDIPIDDFVDVAEENGWFVDGENGGTYTLNMDKMLDYYGIDHDMSFDNDIEDLEDALNDGDKVIVGVDSGQIWYGESNDLFSPETTGDHALEVIGIDRSDPDNPMVVLNDSGSPDGCGEMVPLDVFENAWEAGDSQMIVCRA